MRQVLVGRRVSAAVVVIVMATASVWAGQGSTAKPAPSGQKPAAPAARGGTGARGAAATPATPKRSPGAGPLVVVETVKGTFQFETYPNEAPKSVEHILALVKRNFYNGMRVHRVVPGFVMQFGDPFSRDMSKRDLWGTGGSFNIVGVAEPSPKRTHVLGAVAMAFPGKDPRQADSQIYVTLAPVHRLDGQYTVIGQVLAGMDVVQKLAETDVIRRVTIKE